MIWGCYRLTHKLNALLGAFFKSAKYVHMPGSLKGVADVRIPRRLLASLFAAGIMCSATPSNAAALSEPNREALIRQAAANGGYASVMVTLKVIPLETIKVMGTAALREETEQVARALHAQLGSRALQTGHWNNGMGQIGMLVNADRLDLLTRSAQVIDLQPDQTRGLRDLAWMHHDERSAIEAALNAAGSVELDVVLNSEIGYHIGANGGTVYAASPGAAASHARSLDAITAAAGAGLRWLDDERARRQFGQGPRAHRPGSMACAAHGTASAGFAAG